MPEPGGPGRNGIDRPDGDAVRDRSVATQIRPKVTRPPRFKVILYNDDYTPMEFVVALLEQVFSKSPAAATELMLQIHRKGMGVAGVYVQQIAETKVATVHRLAEQRGHPLRAGMEKE
jgi:ATP-dependent Clp protease adaptor protein ClpS